MQYKIGLISIYLILILPSIISNIDNNFRTKKYNNIEYEKHNNIKKRYISNLESFKYFQKKDFVNERYKRFESQDDRRSTKTQISFQKDEKRKDNLKANNLASQSNVKKTNIFEIKPYIDAKKKYEQEYEYYYLEDDGQDTYNYDSDESDESEENLTSTTDNFYEQNRNISPEDKELDEDDDESYEDY
uniref:Uncharacterized protein n=1 Tax=Strongyloides stercoralis TaxID=6248 RepID=A0A0K0EJ86_STRER